MKAVQLLIDSLLPPDLRDPSRSYDAKGISRLMTEVATRYPERYGEIAKKISDTGRRAAYRQGETLSLSDMRPVVDRDAILQAMDAEVAAAQRKAKTPMEFYRRRAEIWQRVSDMLDQQTQDAALKAGNNLAYSVVSGARGKGAQLKAMLSTPGLYSDYKGDTVPIFIRHSFGEGLRPAEYLAGAFGSRLSVISTKSSTARGGDLLKQMTQAAARQIVTSRDCGAQNGIDLEPNDPSLRGRVLIHAVGKLPAGTLLDRDAVRYIATTAKQPVLVRSALTCQAKEGICAACAGATSKGVLPSIGDAVGITAASAIGEPITQAALNAKHTAGQSAGKKTYSGFDVLEQLVQMPEIFPDRAAVSEVEGKVESIRPAPQGGNLVTISGQSHYVPPGFDVTVKEGESVEPGDPLSEGIVNPADITRLRGLGEGRRYYAKRVKQALDDSNLAASARNVELLARATVDNVIVDGADGTGNFLPDDPASYNSLVTDYTPPATTRSTPIDRRLAGRYLQRPALHYSIGTRLTPRMLEHLESAGFKTLEVDDTPPPFTPEMVRLRTASQTGDDWLAKLHTSFLRKNLAESAVRGEDTNVSQNTHFAPRLAIGQDFGRTVRESGKF